MAPAKTFVLVVEDDDALQDALVGALRDEGYEALAVGSTLEAKAMMIRRAPDLVLLDWMLRGETTTSFLEELSQRSSAPPVVIVSASPAAKALAQQFSVGWSGKPFDIVRLMEVIDDVLRTNARPRSP